MMRIQHNAAVLNSHNNIMKTANKMQKTYEKLSSGYKINGAADDAAGISISEKMRGQINGLAMAEKNIQNGLSLVQVADSGLAQINNPNLIRMRELAVQAANDTLTDADRALIQHSGCREQQNPASYRNRMHGRQASQRLPEVPHSPVNGILRMLIHRYRSGHPENGSRSVNRIR